MTNNELLTMLIKALKSSKHTEAEIFHKVKVAQACLLKASRYPQAFSRKVLKAPVMLVANYGAKQCTTTESVKEVLQDVCPELLSELTPEELTMFCRLVHLQVGVSIPASNDYLKWSTKLMGVVAKKKAGIAYNNPITGFPVNVREYKTDTTEIQYRVFNKLTKTKLKINTKEVNAQSTATTAVPVAIHSIDAGILNKTHERLQKPMALIHDSFGSHPNDLNKMNTAVNESLLEVAQQPTLQNITDQLIKGCEEEITKAEKKSGLTLMTAPTQNTIDNIEEIVLQSKYAFS